MHVLKASLIYESLPAGLAKDDHEAVCRLLGAAFGHCDRKAAACGVAPVSARLVARRGGTIIAQQAIKEVPCVGHPSSVTALGDLAVAPAYRGQGIARELVTRAMATALGGADLIISRTSILAQLFLRLGFEPASDRVWALRSAAMHPVDDAWLFEPSRTSRTVNLKSAMF